MVTFLFQYQQENYMLLNDVDGLIKILDQTIIGQDEAKRVLANAFRDRERRSQLPEKLKSWISVRNILLKGESGTGKTELARQIADLCGCPFITVDCTTLTSSGFVGGDVSKSLRRLVTMGVEMYPKAVANYKKSLTVPVAGGGKRFNLAADLKVLNKFITGSTTKMAAIRSARDYLNVVKKCAASKEDYTIPSAKLTVANKNGRGFTQIKLPAIDVEVSTDKKKPYSDKLHGIFTFLGLCFGNQGVWMSWINPKTTPKCKSTIDDLLKYFVENDWSPVSVESIFSTEVSVKKIVTETLRKSGTNDLFGDLDAFSMFKKNKTTEPETLWLDEVDYKVTAYLNHMLNNADAGDKLPTELSSERKYVENYGIVFLDEIDKLIPNGSGKTHNTTEVQYELLRVLEGGGFDLDANNQWRDDKLGILKTDNVLFICAGAFVNVSEDGLISEIRGRLPISVTLHPLEASHMTSIIRDSKKSPTRQIQELYKTAGLTIDFEDDAIKLLSELSVMYNKNDSNLGARRILGFVERVVSYLTVKEPNETNLVVTTEVVREGLNKYYNENLHMFKIKPLNESLEKTIEFFRSPSSPLVPYKNMLLLKGVTRNIKYPEYRIISVIARSLQWYTDEHELLTREACKMLFETDETFGNTPKFIKEHADKLLPGKTSLGQIGKEEALGARYILNILMTHDASNTKKYKGLLDVIRQQLDKPTK